MVLQFMYLHPWSGYQPRYIYMMTMSADPLSFLGLLARQLPWVR